MMDDLPVIRTMMGHKFPLLIQNHSTKTLVNTQHYATHSKGRPPMLFLSTTASVGSSGLRPAQVQRVNLLFYVHWQIFLDLEQCQEVLVLEWFIFIFEYFCGQHLKLAS